MYRPIPDFPRYKVSDEGQVMSYRAGVWRLMRQSLDPSGYPHVELTRFDGTRKRVAVHRLVLLAFVGPCPEGHECAHRDGNPRNNTLGNLRWATHAANMADHPRTRKLTAVQEQQIAMLYQTDIPSRSELARLFNVPWRVVNRIVSRATPTLAA